MLCVDFCNTLYKLEINRTFIEHAKKNAIKKLKKYTNINMQNEKKIDPFGFREYDARWLFPESINEMGIESVGKGFGTQVIKKNKNPTVIVGHDYRSYSENVKKNFVKGLISTGCNVKDIGLCLSPTVYFSQFKLNSDAVAMITASHNENGWTGIKMGIEKGLTHCKDEMSDLKDIVLNEKFVTGSGKFEEIKEFNNEANFKFPFISENGSIIHNLNFLSSEFPNKIILAKNVYEIQNIFDKNIDQDLKSKCRVISNLTTQEQIQIFGLPENKLKQVFKRTCTIPIKFEGNNKEKLRLKNILLEIGLDFKDGGRVLNLGDRVNKADAMKKIIYMLENKYKSKPKTIAIGDNHNDLEMLKNSDVPCLVKNDKFINKDLQIKNLIISKQTAPEGWVEVVKLALEKIK